MRCGLRFWAVSAVILPPMPLLSQLKKPRPSCSGHGLENDCSQRCVWRWISAGLCRIQPAHRPDAQKRLIQRRLCSGKAIRYHTV